MNFDYIKKDAPEHLTPLYSRDMLNVYFGAIWLCALALLISWPKRPLFDYLETGGPPVCLSGCLMAAVLILSYINLRCGRAELAIVPVREGRKKGLRYLEESRNFLSYGLLAFTLHTVLFLILLMPFFLIAVSVSGGTLKLLSYNIFLIFLTALMFRCFGFFVYLTLGRWNNCCYLFTRSVFFVFFFLTIKFHPRVNPLQTIHGLSMGRQTDISLLSGPYAPYLALVTLSLFALILANQMIIRSREAA